MSDEPKKKSCCARCLLLLLLLVGLVVGYGYYAWNAVRATEPLPFKAFRYGFGERTLLSAKLELVSLPGKLLKQEVKVTLNQRELNAMMFGEEEHSDDGEKARVLIQGDRLRFEYSSPMEGEEGLYVNVQATILLEIKSGYASATVTDGSIGDYDLGPVTRPLVQKAVDAFMQQASEKNKGLRQVRSLTIKDDKMVLVLNPE